MPAARHASITASASVHGRREGLLAQDRALAGRDARQDLLGVVGGRAAEHDDIDRRIGEQVVDTRRPACAHARGELLRPAAAAVGDVHHLEVVAQARERRQVQRGHARARSDDADTVGHRCSFTRGFA